MSSEFINLVTIQTSLGVPVTGDFIEKTLGVEPSHTEKRAKFWKRSDYPKIRQALIEFVEGQEDVVEAERAPAKPKSGNAPVPSPKPSPAPAAAYKDDEEF